jgi:transcription-repair coupling factor (superfamily II helicase)
VKAITLPPDQARQILCNVDEAALAPCLIDHFASASQPVMVLILPDSRALNRAATAIEALLGLDLDCLKDIHCTELPDLREYEPQDSVFLDRQCDLIRSQSLIREACENRKRCLLMTTLPALFQPVVIAEDGDHAIGRVELRAGGPCDLEWLRHQLAQTLGYDYEALCESPGQFALRGGILDVYPVNALQPYRIDFFGDEIEGIRSYDPTTQLSEAKVERLTIYPTRPEAGLNLPKRPFHHLMGCPCIWAMRQSRDIELLHPDAFQIHERLTITIEQRIDHLWNKNHSTRDAWLALDAIAPHATLFGSPTQSLELKSKPTLDCLPRIIVSREQALDPEAHEQGIREVLQKLSALAHEGHRVVIALSKASERERFEAELPHPRPKGLSLHTALLPPGTALFADPQAWSPRALCEGMPKGLILVSESDLHPTLVIRVGRKQQRRSPEIAQVDAMLDFSELADGDYLVHQNQGICIFRGIHKLDPGNNRETLSLEFADGAMLHLALTESHLLSRYIGLAKRSAKLGKLGSNQWEKDRKAAEAATLDLAAELLALQAKRNSKPGYAFPPDDNWMQEFERAFPYTETQGQVEAIRETKSDMEGTRPMDRLICGDVGFGKTEVAMRAAFKAVEAGKQVAVLVPTTVLCQQHFHSFRQRMEAFPVSVAMLSAFRTPQQQDEVIARLSNGQVDVVIGTHRLLSADVAFHNLGLVIVDEEHRFGVKQKERLKRITEHVDVLTLSATPIPRTLYMALTGARDLSVIQTPPRNRLPIETLVRPYSEAIVDRAIRHEVDRGGQVFYLHNRVATIDQTAIAISRRNPGLRVAIGHGQMDKQELEATMTRFIEGAYDLMVCTTIIESGLDIPNCNTLIIEGADHFGLAQLYQIRGRVGRFNRQAYAYLLLHREGRVNPDAKERLTALKQYNELGAGYRIALRDLELRGAGNLLGSAQSGHIAGVGFELYCRLLKQSIQRLQSGSGFDLVRCNVSLDFAPVGEGPVPGQPAKSVSKTQTRFAEIRDAEAEPWEDIIHAHIPRDYLRESTLRIECYRKLASAAGLDEVKRIRASMKDRFGPLPDPVEALIRIAAIRCIAESKNLCSVESDKGRLRLRIANTRTPEYIKNGPHFPRLTKQAPLLVLNECIRFLSKL